MIALNCSTIMVETNDNKIICPNGTPERKIFNAAIFSWAGYIYQGVCALCVDYGSLLSYKFKKLGINTRYVDMAKVESKR